MKTNEKPLAYQCVDELYQHFQSKKFRDDIASCVKSKGSKGMDYVPWSNIMDRFFQACPDATYEFAEYNVKLNDNGIQCEVTLPYTGTSKVGYFVKTSITCFNVTRSMTSPVYGKTFHTVTLAPQANQIHNAQMRCLWKNAAMFGCGLELWTREEESQLKAEAETPEEISIKNPDAVVKTANEIFGGEEVAKESCPKCDSELVVKSSAHGKFLACSGYPNCRFTKSIQ